MGGDEGGMRWGVGGATGRGTEARMAINGAAKAVISQRRKLIYGVKGLRGPRGVYRPRKTRRDEEEIRRRLGVPLERSSQPKKTERNWFERITHDSTARVRTPLMLSRSRHSFTACIASALHVPRHQTSTIRGARLRRHMCCAMPDVCE